MDGSLFERLCTDLLAREGYREIVPIGGTYDGGRDAEIHRWKGIKETGGITFFQYSLENNWENKLKRELKKVKDNKHRIDFYVFVTSRKVTGNRRDKLRQMVAAQYGWLLVIYDREWFRHRLEEAHPDLAAKYLGISEIPGRQPIRVELKPVAPHDQIDKAWQLYLLEEYEAAVVEFKRLLKESDQNIDAWRALAWCQYSLFHYQEALASINHAVSLDTDNALSWSLKASILTEDGVQRGIRANLLLAKDIFCKIAEKSKQWVDHYNYGNALQALGEYDAAKHEFLLALDYNPKQAEVWKNLGSVYFHLHDHQEEIRCYEEALAINSELPEALASKGVTLLRVFGKAEEAIDLLTHALETDDTFALRWPHAWYWLSQAYLQLDRLEAALEQVNSGLTVVPYHSGLLGLKASILTRLWPGDDSFIKEALPFFEFMVSLSPDDYDSFAELTQLYRAAGQDDSVWELVENRIGIGKDDFLTYQQISQHSFDDSLASLKYLSAYERFRGICTLAEYTDLLTAQGIVPDSDFENAMFFICLVPFGLACDLWANLPLEERAGVTEDVYSAIANSLLLSFPHCGLKLLGALEIDTTEKAVDGLSGVLATWPNVALLELGRQVGFIGALFGVHVYHLDQEIVRQGEKLGEWQGKIASKTFLEINKELRIFKE